jgi:hypothetical protein
MFFCAAIPSLIRLVTVGHILTHKKIKGKECTHITKYNNEYRSHPQRNNLFFLFLMLSQGK